MAIWRTQRSRTFRTMNYPNHIDASWALFFALQIFLFTRISAMTKFRLSRIIEIKEKLIEDKERELEGAMNVLNDIIAGIDCIEKDTENSYNRLTVPEMSGGDFTVIKDYLSFLESRRLSLLDEKAHTETTIDLLRADLVELLKELKMLETLQSKTFKAMKKTANRREQKNLDAMALRLSESSQLR